MIDALRDYAEEWMDDLCLAPDHAEYRDLVILVSHASDAELWDWLLGRGRPTNGS
ncbi:hypothetical protein [Myceligenerans crystallogenes]|uniref:FAD assembly factor SdhE n=1 Tax=Myceligenerans crystallogenes TaxID=316335 RepID=A0ABP4ZCK4_9MICO